MKIKKVLFTGMLTAVMTSALIANTFATPASQYGDSGGSSSKSSNTSTKSGSNNYIGGENVNGNYYVTSKVVKISVPFNGPTSNRPDVMVGKSFSNLKDVSKSKVHISNGVLSFDVDLSAYGPTPYIYILDVKGNVYKFQQSPAINVITSAKLKEMKNAEKASQSSAKAINTAKTSTPQPTASFKGVVKDDVWVHKTADFNSSSRSRVAKKGDVVYVSGEKNDLYYIGNGYISKSYVTKDEPKAEQTKQAEPTKDQQFRQGIVTGDVWVHKTADFNTSSRSRVAKKGEKVTIKGSSGDLYYIGNGYISKSYVK